MNNKNIPTPTAKEVDKYLKKWQTLTNYVAQEKALNKLFSSLCPHNEDIDDILIKVSILNDFYSTHLRQEGIHKVANRILDLNLTHCCTVDARLMCGDLSLVSDIANATKKSANGRGNYSFATKYCSFHNSKVFPIYDKNVDSCLQHFRNNHHFYKFSNKDLIDYPKFKEILQKFMSYYKLTNFSLKEIDRYLWQLGKEYS